MVEIEGVISRIYIKDFSYFILDIENIFQKGEI
jgi:hypothetical protein